MKRSNSRDSHRSEKPGSSRQEDGKSVSRPKTEEEKLRRRREWMIQQQREREHEKLKKKMILEYEIRRAKEKGLPLPKRRSPSRGSSKTRSRSEDSRHGRSSPSRSPRPLVMSEKVESSSGTKQQLFKGPEGTQISTAELRRIKVDIHRNIPAKTTVKNELERDIVNPEDVVLKRREGNMLFCLYLYSFIATQPRSIIYKQKAPRKIDIIKELYLQLKLEDANILDLISCMHSNVIV